jgi:hypothetical protein
MAVPALAGTCFSVYLVEDEPFAAFAMIDLKETNTAPNPNSIGIWNALAIATISVLMFFLSIISLLSKSEYDRLMGQWWDTFLGRQFWLATASLMFVGALLLLNLIHDLVAYQRPHWRRMLNVLIWGMGACIAVTLVGNSMFMAG